MADITVTAGSVVAGSGAVVIRKTAGATITAGQVVYKATDGDYELADADVLASAGSVTDRESVGIALNGASAGQPLSVQISGTINPGATTVVGDIYRVSATAGGIASDQVDVMASGDFKTILGVGMSTSAIKMGINVSGVVKA